MKKIIKIILCCLIIFTFSGCTEEKENSAKTIKWNKENKLADLVSYQIESIGKPQQISPDVISQTYTYYKPQKETNVLLDLVMNITNLKDKDLDLQKKLTASFKIKDEEYVCSIATLSDDGTSLIENGKILGNNVSKVHFYAEINPKKLNQQIEFVFSTTDDKPQSAILKFKLDEVNKNYQTINLNELLTLDNYCEITFQATNTLKEIAPANPTGLYNCYKIENENNSYFDLTTTVKNISGDNIIASNIALMRLIDEDGNEYPVNVFCENESQSDLSEGNGTTIAVNQSMIVHFAFEIPDKIIEQQKTIRIIYQGKGYLLKL